MYCIIGGNYYTLSSRLQLRRMTLGMYQTFHSRWKWGLVHQFGRNRNLVFTEIIVSGSRNRSKHSSKRESWGGWLNRVPFCTRLFWLVAERIAWPNQGQAYCLCIDFREVNRRTTVDRYPAPDLQDCLCRVAGATCYSSIDLKAGFHNIPDRPWLTAVYWYSYLRQRLLVPVPTIRTYKCTSALSAYDC